MAICTTPDCGNDLSAEGAVQYLSGDKKDCHIDEKGELIFDGEGECDSRIECARCGKDVEHLVVENHIWD